MVAHFTGKGDRLYAILPRWQGGNFRLKGIAVSARTRVSLLGGGGTIEWRRSGGDTVITMPSFLAAGEVPSAVHQAWVLKLENALANEGRSSRRSFPGTACGREAPKFKER